MKGVDEKELLRSELPVLLNVFSAASHSITGDTLYKRYPKVADKLIRNEWLIPVETFSTIVVNKETKKVVWRPEVGEHQFFSPFLGWTTIPENRLKRYQVNMIKCMFWLLKEFKIHPTSKARMLVEDSLCDLGFTVINGKFIKVYLCARLKNMKVNTLVSDAIKSQIGQYQGVLITDDVGFSPLNISSKLIEIKFSSLLKKGLDYCEINMALLEDVVDKFADNKSKKNLIFSDDYRIVEWDGIRYSLTKKQSSIIEALHKSGGRSHKDYLQAQADTNTEIHRIMRNRVDKKWVQHPLWNTLIKKSGAGYYQFDESADYEKAFSVY